MDERMPKIVDHKAHSQDLAQRAAKYFSDHGYAGTSMRKVAAYLGLSKSALYHYFPTKEHLFLACTRQVMGGLDRTFIDATASDEENLAQLKEVLRKDFASEMALVFEYLRGKSSTEIVNDEAMQVAMDAYRKMVASIVGEDEAEERLARLFGSLMLDYMSGR